MNASDITLDITKSPAVTFATLRDGTVLACEPDGVCTIGSVGPKGEPTRLDPKVRASILLFVRVQARRVRS